VRRHADVFAGVLIADWSHPGRCARARRVRLVDLRSAGPGLHSCPAHSPELLEPVRRPRRRRAS
jgi:hypothetical protein